MTLPPIQTKNALAASSRKNDSIPRTPRLPPIRPSNALAPRPPLTAAVALRELANHPDLRESLPGTKRVDNLPLIRRALAGFKQVAVDQYRTIREDSGTFAASTAASFVPGVRTRVNQNRVQGSANRSLVAEQAASSLPPLDVRRGLYKGYQRGEDLEFRNDLASLTTTTVQDGLTVGGVTGLASPIVAAVGLGFKAINTLVDIGTDEGVPKRQDARKNPQDSAKFSAALATSPGLSRNMLRSMADSRGIEPTPRLPYSQDRPVTPLKIRAARARRFVDPSVLSTVNPKPAELRAQARYRHR